MPGEIGDWWGTIALVTFAGGAWLGIWSEARLWRGKAESGLRRESGGKLYRVTLERP